MAVPLPNVRTTPYTRSMNRKLAQVIEDGLALDADDREIAAISLQQVDADEQVAIDADWDAEIDRRVVDILSGKVELVDGEETRRIARARLAARG